MLNPKAKQGNIKRPDVLLAIQEEEERTDRTNFPDRVKAEIYARDRAICAFTGMNLWLLDEGAGGFYNVCCIDHVIPATKGGTSTADNGVATFVAYNYQQRQQHGRKSVSLYGWFADFSLLGISSTVDSRNGPNDNSQLTATTFRLQFQSSN